MKKQYCGSCIHLKYEDADGLGYCELWQESDVSVEDEDCVEHEEEPEDE
jgi:hypothetical protein